VQANLGKVQGIIVALKFKQQWKWIEKLAPETKTSDNLKWDLPSEEIEIMLGFKIRLIMPETINV